MDAVLVRSAALRVAFVVLLVLLSLAGSASAQPPGASSAVAITPAPPARVAAALFTPSRTDEGLAWNARWVLAPASVDEIYADGPRTLRFARPLPEGARLEHGAGVTPVREPRGAGEEGSQVVGIVVSRAALHGREVHATVRQPVPSSTRAPSVVLAAPIAEGTSLQVLDADLGSGTRLAVAEGRVLEQHVGFMSPAGVSLSAREEARRLTGHRERVSGAAVYVRGEDVRVAGGLSATLETPRDRGRPGVIAIGLAFGAIVVALLLAVKRLRHAASVERADAILAAEVDALPASRLPRTPVQEL